MEELSQLSPASREAALEALPRKELQQLAKEIGVKVQEVQKDWSELCPSERLAKLLACAGRRATVKAKT